MVADIRSSNLSSEDLDEMKIRVSNHTRMKCSWEYCIRFSGALKNSDELKSDLASDSSRDLIHPGERSWIL